MQLLQWNIQWCRGIDGRVDPARIARVAKELCDPDVCCFQEVADNYDSLAGSSGEDQPSLLQKLFPGYSAHFAWAVDVPDGKGGRRRFGNLILSRLPVRRVFRHSLPWPPENGVPNMPRVAIEAVIQAPWGLVGVITTHLEYYSSKQRAAQVGRLCDLQAEGNLHSKSKPAETYKAGPFEPFPRPASSILAGDFVVLGPGPAREGDVVAIVDPLDSSRWTLRRVESDGGTIRYDEGGYGGEDGPVEVLEMGRAEQVLTLQEGDHLVRRDTRAVAWEMAEVPVATGTLFLGADDRDRAMDSRWWGAVPAEAAQGVVLVRFGASHTWRGWVTTRP